MYIEFQLPQGAGGLAPQLALEKIRSRLNSWAEKHNCKYKTKIFKYTLRVTFDCNESYTLFGLTWQPDPKYPSWTSYRLVVDLNNKV